MRRSRGVALALALIVIMGAGATAGITLARWRRAHVPTLTLHLARVKVTEPRGFDLSFLDKGRLLCAVGALEHETVEVWSIAKSEPALVRVIELPGEPPYEVDPGGEWVHEVASEATVFSSFGSKPRIASLVSALTGETVMRFEREWHPRKEFHAPEQCRAGLSPDASLLALERADRTIEVRRVPTNELVSKIALPRELEGEVWELRFVGPHRLLVWTVHDDYTFDEAWSARLPGDPWRRLPLSKADSEGDGEWALARDGIVVHLPAPKTRAQLRSLETKEPAFDVSFPSRVPLRVPLRRFLGAEGERLVSVRFATSAAPGSGQVEVFATRTGERLARFLPPAPFTKVFLSPDGDRVATVRPDGTVEVWDVSP